MATEVILPALGMAQDTGKIVRWLKAQGTQVTRGEALLEIETDKATVEVEAPASGLLAQIMAAAGDEVPVGQVIALILSPEEVSQKQAQRPTIESPEQQRRVASTADSPPGANGATPRDTNANPPAVATSLLASRIAAEHQVDLSQVKTVGSRVQKADVLAYLQEQKQVVSDKGNHITLTSSGGRLVLASPKARRLAREQGKNLSLIKGTGPQSAILAADVLAAQVAPVSEESASIDTPEILADEAGNPTVSTIWRIMAERTTQSWTSVPHFFLVREVNASRLVAWYEHLLQQGAQEVTYTDLLVKIVATALRLHPQINATWHAGKIALMQEIHVGLAVAVEEGLVVPVIHGADKLDLRSLARQRKDLIGKARAGKLRPQDISEGTFTISNLGMYGVDAFNAIINAPQVAILAVGRIAERVVAVNSQPAVHPMLTLTLSCDHRAVDGAHGAQFLSTIAGLIEEPLGLLD